MRGGVHVGIYARGEGAKGFQNPYPLEMWIGYGYGYGRLEVMLHARRADGRLDRGCRLLDSFHRPSRAEQNGAEQSPGETVTVTELSISHLAGREVEEKHARAPRKA